MSQFRRVLAAILLVSIVSDRGLAEDAKPAAVPSSPLPSKRIYIANDDHTDFMWTADADTYARTFVEMLNFHMQLADETSDNPPPYQNRFNADCSYWLWSYEKTATPAEFERLISCVKNGTISAPLNTVVSCYGGQPVEAILRSMYYSGRLERRYDMRFPLVTAMENQTLPRGLASLFAGAGAQYSWRGICGCATRMKKEQFATRPKEMYWWTGPDGQRVLLKWYSYGPGQLGGYWEAGNPREAIRIVDKDERFLSRYLHQPTQTPYNVIGLFGFGGDDLGRKTGVTPPPTIPGVPGLQKVISSPYQDHFHQIAREQTTASRQVIVSNEVDFFEDFEQQYGHLLESESVTYGNEWDLYSASMSETCARVKRSIEKLRAAELLASLVSMKYPTFMDRHETARDQAFADIGLFWEHNWTADGPISRTQRGAWQNMVASQIEYYVDSLYGEALIRLGGMISRPDKAERFFVLNPLGWNRTDVADYLYSGKAEVHVVDIATGETVPHQLIKNEAGRSLRILATDVPSAGYKVFEIRPGQASEVPSALKATPGEPATLENGFVRIVLQPDGALSSLVDLKTNRELADTIGGLRLNDLAADSDAGDAVVVEQAGPVSVTLRASSDAGLPHTTRVTLYAHSDRVDLENVIEANFGDVRHWGFSFDIDQPHTHTEEVGAINLNRLASDGGHYANTHARYDYLTVNHFADLSSGENTYGVTISNPDLAFGRLGNSTVETLDAQTPQLHMLAGGQVDGKSLGIPRQFGQTRFTQRFSLRVHDGYQPTEAMKFSLEHQNPLVTGAVISLPDKGVYDAMAYSLVQSADPNVVLWCVKPHDDGIDRGLMTRWWNLGEAEVSSHVNFTPSLSKAWRTTHIETDLEVVQPKDGNQLPVSFAPQQLQTYRVQFLQGQTPE